jgi:hypothetical protein
MQITIAHSLPQNEAKKKISQFLEEKYREHKRMISDYEMKWSGNTCHVKGSAKNINVNGNVSVLPEAVEVDLKVPLAFFPFKSKIKDVITSELSEVLK